MAVLVPLALSAGCRAEEEACYEPRGPVSSAPWATSFGGKQDEEQGTGIAVDCAGYSYVTGEFGGTAGGTARFGRHSLTSQGDGDIFVTRLDASGEVQWAFSAGSSGWDSGEAIAVDRQGNSYVTGFFDGTAAFGSTTLTMKHLPSGLGSDAFVAKLDPEGEVLWAVAAGGSDARGSGIAVDRDGNSYVIGRFEHAIRVNGTTYAAHPGGPDIFVVKVSPDGRLLWAVTLGGKTWFDGGRAIAVDHAGNCYITGYSSGPATFGDKAVVFPRWDVFVAKLSTSGEVLWVVSAGGAGEDEGRGVAVDDAGYCYVTGDYAGPATFGSTTLTTSYEPDAFVTKLSPDGEFLWAVSTGGDNVDLGLGIAVDRAGNSHLAGVLSGTATIGSTTLTSGAMVAKLSPEGKFLWATSVGRDFDDSAAAIAVDSLGHGYLTGHFHGSLRFSGTLLMSDGGNDIFAWRLPAEP